MARSSAIRTLLVAAALTPASCVAVLQLDEVTYPREGPDATADALGSDTSTPPSDAPPLDAAPDAATAPCDPRGAYTLRPFTELAPPSPLYCGFGGIACVRFSHDERDVYFAAAAGDAGSRIWKASRAGPTGAFAPAELLPNVNATAAFSPVVTADDLTLYYVTSSATGNIVRATRAQLDAAFENPGIVASGYDPGPHPGGREVWLDGKLPNQANVLQAVDLKSAVPRVAPFESLDGSTASYAPVWTEDGKFLFFTSNRTPAARPYTVFFSEVIDGGFSPPELPTAFQSPTEDRVVQWVSPDRCRIYFTQGPIGTSTLYVATGQP